MTVEVEQEKKRIMAQNTIITIIDGGFGENDDDPLITIRSHKAYEHNNVNYIFEGTVTQLIRKLNK